MYVFAILLTYFSLTSLLVNGRTFFTVQIDHPKSGAVLGPMSTVIPSVDVLALTNVPIQSYELCYSFAVRNEHVSECVGLEGASPILEGLQHENTQRMTTSEAFSKNPAKARANSNLDN